MFFAGLFTVIAGFILHSIADYNKSLMTRVIAVMAVVVGLIMMWVTYKNGGISVQTP